MDNHSSLSVPAMAYEEAKLWLGTPYRHQGRRRGVACDCLGLIIGVWQALYNDLPETPRNYPRDWNLSEPQDTLMESAMRHLLPVGSHEVVPGDVLLFRWNVAVGSRHLAIAAPNNCMIHAYERHAVLVSKIVPSWQRRISGTFRFPTPAT